MGNSANHGRIATAGAQPLETQTHYLAPEMDVNADLMAVLSSAAVIFGVKFDRVLIAFIIPATIARSRRSKKSTSPTLAFIAVL